MHTKSYRAFREIACVASVSVCFRAKKDRGTRFSVLAARKMERERKNKRAFLVFLFFFRATVARSLTLAFLVLCSETARKRLLSRLFEKRAVFSVGLVNSLREPLFQNVCINKAPDLLHRKQTRKSEIRMLKCRFDELRRGAGVGGSRNSLLNRVPPGKTLQKLKKAFVPFTLAKTHLACDRALHWFGRVARRHARATRERRRFCRSVARSPTACFAHTWS